MAYTVQTPDEKLWELTDPDYGVKSKAERVYKKPSTIWRVRRVKWGFRASYGSPTEQKGWTFCEHSGPQWVTYPRAGL